MNPVNEFLGPPRPHSVFFFPNGTAAVGDQYGRQMPQYQAGGHADTLAALAADGIDLDAIPEVCGVPRVPTSPRPA